MKCVRQDRCGGFSRLLMLLPEGGGITAASLHRTCWKAERGGGEKNILGAGAAPDI